MQRLLEILLSNAVIAAIPAMLAILLARLWRRPALIHALWLVALLKLVTPPLVNVPVKVLPPAAPAHAAEIATDGWPTPSGVGERFLPAPSTQTPRDLPSRISWPTVLLAAWAAGSVTLLLLTIARLRRFNALLRLAAHPSRTVLAHAGQVAAHLNLPHCPKILFLPGAISPMLWAIGSRACLLLPIDLWRKLSPDQRSSLLAHELAHYKRRDHWVRCLELLATILYWWHPLVWLARRELRDAEEQCCDAWVVHVMPQHSRAYATALLDTVDFISQANTPMPPAASGIGNIKDLKRRLVMIMQAAHPRRLSSAGRIAVLTLGLLVLPALPRLVADEPRAVRNDANQSVKEFRGMFTKAEQTTLLISVGEGGTEMKVPTDEDTRIFIDGAAAKLSDLKPEMFLTIRQADGITTRIDARSPRGAARFGEGEARRDGDRPREGEVRRDGDRPQGEVRRDGDAPRREGAMRDGERPREGARDGDRPKEGARDGERPREGARDGERPREGARDGERPREGARDGERPREGAMRDGDRPREGARDGDRPREGARDGERPREGAARDGERPRENVAREGERPRGEGEFRSANLLRGRVERVLGDDGVQLTGGEGREGLKIPIDDKTRIFVNGKPGKLDEIKPGMMVQAHRFEGVTTVIEARTAREPNRRERPAGEGDAPGNQGDRPRRDGDR